MQNYEPSCGISTFSRNVLWNLVLAYFAHISGGHKKIATCGKFTAVSRGIWQTGPRHLENLSVENCGPSYSIMSMSVSTTAYEMKFTYWIVDVVILKLILVLVFYTVQWILIYSFLNTILVFVSSVIILLSLECHQFKQCLPALVHQFKAWAHF